MQAVSGPVLTVTTGAGERRTLSRCFSTTFDLLKDQFEPVELAADLRFHILRQGPPIAQHSSSSRFLRLRESGA
jgi:hypothetical protein